MILKLLFSGVSSWASMAPMGGGSWAAMPMSAGGWSQPMASGWSMPMSGGWSMPMGGGWSSMGGMFLTIFVFLNFNCVFFRCLAKTLI